MTEPTILDDALYQLLWNDDVSAFNEQRPEGPVAFVNAHLRGVDLRGANLLDVDLSGAYCRNADLRGLDLSRTNLRGASLADAKISGVLFPPDLPAEEIRLSVEHGTRMRY